jgi:hypothetical protein
MTKPLTSMDRARAKRKRSSARGQRAARNCHNAVKAAMEQVNQRIRQNLQRETNNVPL